MCRRQGSSLKPGYVTDLKCMKYPQLSMLGMSEFDLGSRPMEQEMCFRV